MTEIKVGELVNALDDAINDQNVNNNIHYVLNRANDMGTLVIGLNHLHESFATKLKKNNDDEKREYPFKEYAAPLAKVMINKHDDYASKVLCIFLGPSDETDCDNKDASHNWSAFHKKQTYDDWCQSLKPLHTKCQNKGYKNGLADFILSDAFPHKRWKPSNQTTYEKLDMKFAGEWVTELVKCAQPKVVLVFGSASCWIVANSLNQFHKYSIETLAKSTELQLSHMSTNAKYSFPLSSTPHVDNGIHYFFLPHPSSFSQLATRTKYDETFDKLNEILEPPVQS